VAKKRIKDIQNTTGLQNGVFFLIFLISVIITFPIGTEAIEYVVVNGLRGEVFNVTGDERAVDRDEDKSIKNIQSYITAGRNEWQYKIRKISYWNNWAVDLYKDTNNPVRFWFNPVLALFAFIIFFSIIISILITTLLPSKYGYFRQKIEREVIISLDRIYYIRNGEYFQGEPEGIREELSNADLNKVYELEKELNMTRDDIFAVIKAVEWEANSGLYRFIHPLRGIGLYLTNHFTERYANAILSIVYIGAAFLIIIIGLRGLKFIPASEPSLVFFALGLEFSILITYAITLLFSKPEEQSKISENTGSGDYMIQSDKQMEKLLRSFINWKKKV